MGSLVPIDERDLTDDERRNATPCSTLFYRKRNERAEIVGN